MRGTFVYCSPLWSISRNSETAGKVPFNISLSVQTSSLTGPSSQNLLAKACPVPAVVTGTRETAAATAASNLLPGSVTAPDPAFPVSPSHHFLPELPHVAGHTSFFRNKLLEEFRVFSSPAPSRGLYVGPAPSTSPANWEEKRKKVNLVTHERE